MAAFKNILKILMGGIEQLLHVYCITQLKIVKFIKHNIHFKFFCGVNMFIVFKGSSVLSNFLFSLKREESFWELIPEKDSCEQKCFLVDTHHLCLVSGTHEATLSWNVHFGKNYILYSLLLFLSGSLNQDIDRPLSKAFILSPAVLHKSTTYFF